jgi:hypothetical protein
MVDRFWVEHAGDSLFQAAAVDSTVQDTSLTLDSLEGGTTYWWRVRAHNGGGWGPFGSSRSFHVSQLPLADNPPLLLSPEDGLEGAPTNITLQWSRPARAEMDSLHYHVQIANEVSFLFLVENDSTISDTTFQPAGLAVATRYYWRVRVQNDLRSGPWSATRHFRTIVPLPPAPALLTPLDSSIVTLDSTFLRWRRGLYQSNRYWVEYGLNPALAQAWIDSSVTDTATALHGLADGKRYYWRVRALNETGWGSFSPTVTFIKESRWVGVGGSSAIPCKAISKFTVTAIPAGALRMTAVMADSFYVGEMIAVSVDGTQYLLTVDSSGVAQSIVTQLKPGTHTVMLVSPDDCFSPLSVRTTALLAPRLFTADRIEALDPRVMFSSLVAQELPVATALTGSYPNPFNPRVTIMFDVATNEHVSAKVYDILGREVAILIDEQMRAGRHRIQWDASYEASGTYFLRFQAGGLIQTGKLSLVK